MRAFAFSLLLCALTVQAQNYKVIFSFAGPDGAFPNSGFLVDASGNVYGTTSGGGLQFARCKALGGCGTIFRLSATASGRWSASEYKFKGGTNDGSEPAGSLVADAAGNLYGVTNGGGSTGFGTAFKASFANGVLSETPVYSFQGTPAADGAYPAAGLAIDTAGNLYGTTTQGGQYNKGAVFELSPNSSGGWTETLIYSFSGAVDGWSPQAPLTLDAAGNLYGTTIAGGLPNTSTCLSGCGVVFELSPNSSGGWTETVLHAFDYSDGKWPASKLVFDASGNLYGTAVWGGNVSTSCQFGSSIGCGVVFQLSNVSGQWNEKTIFTFNDANGANPFGLAFDPSGNLFGATVDGGAGQAGTVYRLTRGPNGFWNERVIQPFSAGTGGGGPSGVTFDSSGKIFGAANYAGTTGYGVIFSIQP
jgi:uncharacterized repeat protein (TIGR03803 family)